MWGKTNRAFRIAAIYIVFGGSWVLFSDKILGEELDSLHEFAVLGTLKGVAFVVVTGIFLYFVVEREALRARALTSELQVVRDTVELALESTSHATFAFDPASGEVRMSSGIAHLIGAQSPPACREEWFARIHPDDIEQVEEALGKHLAGETEQYQATYRVRREDGRYITVMSQGRLQNVKGELGQRMIGTLTDITELDLERRKSERLANALKSLLNVNHAIVNAENPDDMYSAVCAALAAPGPFPLAWIGIVRHDQEKSIEVVARAGSKSEFADKIRLSWDPDHQYGKGSAGNAVRTGEVQTVHDMAVLEPNSPWRNLAQKYGLHSRIAIPFHVAGAVKGILSVYGEATQLFGEDDIALLQNIGDDIGYYVATYETGQRVRNAEEAQRLAEQRELELRERAILALAQVIEQRDPYTAEHQRRVAEIAVAIARQMRLDDDFVSELALGAKIHDLGKIAIPSDLLSRSGKLSDGEMALVREHVRLGHDIVHNMKLPENIAMPVLYHHERLDGSGYPEGLKGDEIPLSARIIAVADTLEAMAAHRPYRAALGVNTALNILREERGIRYDSAVVDACLAAMKQGDLIERLQLPLNSAA